MVATRPTWHGSRPTTTRASTWCPCATGPSCTRSSTRPGSRPSRCRSCSSAPPTRSRRTIPASTATRWGPRPSSTARATSSSSRTCAASSGPTANSRSSAPSRPSPRAPPRSTRAPTTTTPSSGRSRMWRDTTGGWGSGGSRTRAGRRSWGWWMRTRRLPRHHLKPPLPTCSSGTIGTTTAPLGSCTPSPG